jgi:hypothetical protein
LTEARTVDPAQSSGRKVGITEGLMEPVLRWLAEIVAAVIQPFRFFSRPTYPASSDVTAEKGSEGVVEGTQAVVTVTEDAVVRPTTVKSFAASVPLTLFAKSMAATASRLTKARTSVTPRPTSPEHLMIREP